MDLSLQSVATAATDVASNQMATPDVRTEQGGGMGADFSNVLEGFRQRAANVEQAGSALLAKPGAAQTANDRSIRQLAELYTYAVDMQVMVRTGGQLTSGLRQLITGQ
jgi:hypothetical protein